MQDIVSIFCLEARKLCLVVDIQVKIWSCTLSYKNCHITLLCHQDHYGTILTIFAKFKYEIDFDKLAITLQPTRMEELCPFHLLIKKRTSASLVWEISKQLKVFSCFSLPTFDLLLFYLMERTTSATYNILQANWVVFCWFFLIKVRQNCHFWSCSISNFFVGICDIYLENRLFFFFGFDIEKTIPVSIPTHLVTSFI